MVSHARIATKERNLLLTFIAHDHLSRNTNTHNEHVISAT